MMKRILFTILHFILSLTIFAQSPYRTCILSPNLKTLQVGIKDEKYLIPVIELNGNQQVEISFDEMSHENKAFSYQVFHCNADWSLSTLSSTEYLQGFITGNITDYQHSNNTHILYTHYRFNFPNEELQAKISGNYLIKIFLDNNIESPVAYACLSIVEPRVTISGIIRGNTDRELNGRFQQLDFDIALNGYAVRDAITDIKPVVRQNNRFDNEVQHLKPYNFTAGKISYLNNPALIFEGGNEFHAFDISSAYNAGRGVSETKFNNGAYETYLYPDKLKPRSYLSEQDVNGRFLINYQESFTDATIEADYFRVYFTLPAASPFFDGQIFLGGDMVYNLQNQQSALKYDNEKAAYTTSLLLKQGGYSYQYLFLPKGSSRGITERTEGSFWQTSNEYTIYVYHREWGGRYDKLVGVKTVLSND